MNTRTFEICLVSPKKIDTGATQLPDGCAPMLVMTCNGCGKPIVNAENAVLGFELLPKVDIPAELLGQDDKGNFVYQLPGSIELLHEECFTGPGLSVPAWAYISTSSKLTYKPNFRGLETEESSRPN